MIICPNCKEEIEEDSHFCDQCGHELLYCSSCGHVGIGRRCTHCGGLMVSADEKEKQSQAPREAAAVPGNANAMPGMNAAGAMPGMNAAGAMPGMNVASAPRRPAEGSQMPVQKGIPTLTLYNPTLDIRMQGVNGAIIGRRQGPYQQLFEGNMYISGIHAQLIYKPDAGWCIIDKNSSNGTKLNQRDLSPDVPTPMKAGDIVTLANINLQVSLT